MRNGSNPVVKFCATTTIHITSNSNPALVLKVMQRLVHSFVVNSRDTSHFWTIFLYSFCMIFSNDCTASCGQNSLLLNKMGGFSIPKFIIYAFEAIFLYFLFIKNTNSRLLLILFFLTYSWIDKGSVNSPRTKLQKKTEKKNYTRKSVG